MEKLGLLVKEIAANQIKNNLKSAHAFFVVRYAGLSSPDMTQLRYQLRSAKAKLFVVKNSVARIVLKEVGLESILRFVEGPCGLVFVADEPVGASRILYDFSREHQQLKLEAGFSENRILERKDIETLAKLPSREVLRVQLLLALNSPLTKLVRVFSGTLKKLVYCLDQIATAKAQK